MLNKLSEVYSNPGIHFTDIDGTEVANVVSSIESEVHAIRHSVAISDMSHICAIRLSGEHAHVFLNRLAPRNLNIRNNKLFQSLFILDDAWRYADVYVAKEHDAYLLLVRGLDADYLIDWLKQSLLPDEDVNIHLMNDTHSILTFNGPFAWELLSDLVDPEIISLPYLSFYYPEENQIIIRSGETGEFGYLLIYPHDSAQLMWRKALDIGSTYDIRQAGIDALDYCALENNFFNVHKEGSIGANPKELQLQWRLSYGKHFTHTGALQAMREEPIKRRMIAIYSETILVEKGLIFCNNDEIGFIINSAPYLSGEGYIGLAMIQWPYAESGVVNEYQSSAGAIRTVSPPFINNRSLVINPQIHSYLDLDEIQFLKLDALGDI